MATPTRPLVVTGDGELLDEVLAVAGAAGVAVDVAVDLAAARPQWTSAALVVLGADVGTATPDAVRRPGVLLVGSGARPAATGFAPDDLLGLPADEAELMARLAETLEPARAATTVAVVSGRGGAGASTLAGALALAAAARGDTAWLVDLDPLGGGADSVLGAELAAGVRWAELSGTDGRVSARALRDAAPQVSGVCVLAADGRTIDGGPEPAAVRSVLAAARRGGGTLVLDLPRHPTAARHTALAVADRVLLVVPAEVRAVLAARQVVAALEPAGATGVVVRRVPGGLPPAEVARAVDLPLAGTFGDEQSVRIAGLVGCADDLLAGGGLGRLCAELLSACARPDGVAA